MGQSAAAILTNYLNNFKLTFDLELAKNTPEDLMLHFITPVIPNFKNESKGAPAIQYSMSFRQLEGVLMNLYKKFERNGRQEISIFILKAIIMLQQFYMHHYIPKKKQFNYYYQKGHQYMIKQFMEVDIFLT
jgi:hypothetical protein